VKNKSAPSYFFYVENYEEQMWKAL